MATLRELKGRIGSVASSEKITGAMKMISSAKMHKAESALRQLVPYKAQIETIMASLLESDAQFTSVLVTPREIRHITLVAWGSDDGLCGAYNANMGKFLNQAVENHTAAHPDATIEVIAVGRKMYKAAARMHADNVTVVPAMLDTKAAGAEVDAFTNSLRDNYMNGVTDYVEAVYMHFRTAGKQIATQQQMLPVRPESLEGGNNAKQSARPFLFEPDPNTIFNTVLPMFLLSAMQEIFTENRASEQAARIMAMQSANDNAKKLLESLNLEYNKLRQQSITSELLDIVGGQVRD